MRKPVSCHIIGKLPGAFEQQIILNAANIFAAAEGTDAASAGVDFWCERDFRYCIQGLCLGVKNYEHRIMRVGDQQIR